MATSPCDACGWWTVVRAGVINSVQWRSSKPTTDISFGMEIPFYVNLTNGVFGSIPILFGPGFEYHIDDHISLGFNTKFGPDIFAQSNGVGGTNNAVVFGLIAQAFFAYRL